MKLSEMTTEQIRDAAAENGCRLLAVETAGAGRFSVLRVVLERSSGEGATIDDCEAVSRQVSRILDGSDEIPHRYSLEVSSAGLDRKLYSLEDACRFINHRVRVKTDNPVIATLAEGAKHRGPPVSARNFSGILEKVDADLLTIVDDTDGKIYNVRFGDIRVAKLDFHWKK
jgi:ribosome maturation factor RimP